MSVCWKELSNVPLEDLTIHTRVAKPVPLNQYEYLIPMGKDLNSLKSIIKYSAVTNEYSTFLSFQDALVCRINSGVNDTENQTMYIPGKEGILKIDLVTKSFEYVSKTQFRYGLSTIILNNKLHVFHYPTKPIIDISDDEDVCYSEHTIYNIKSKESKTMPVILPGLAEGCEFGDDEQMIFIKSQNKLVFLGGDLDPAVVLYDIGQNKWEVMKDVRLLSPELYDGHSAVITKDQRYIIVLSAYEDDVEDSEGSVVEEAWDNLIEIIDVEQEISWTSKAKLPCSWKDEELHAFLVDNYHQTGIIVNGYLRQYRKQQRVIPLELIQMIVQFYSQNDIHIIQRNTGKHWVASLGDILTFD